MAHWQESDRIAALHGLSVLDKELPGFEDYTRIAAMICDAPIAVVNLIDAARQWFAAEIGLGVRETPLDISICATAIQQNELFVVPDLALDSRFSRNPLVTGAPHLRFYGGALLLTASGLPLGTICVLDHEPRPAGLTAEQAFALQALARQIMRHFELRQLLAEKELLVLEAHHRVANSLQMAGALLSMQAAAAGEEAVAEPLRQGAGRLAALGAMHARLQDTGARGFALTEYLAGLVADQNAALATARPGRSIGFAGSAIAWPGFDAPTIGLIMVELATNALKYGQGHVAVTLWEEAGSVLLRVEDEGTGLPADFDPRRHAGLGMSLILGLLEGREGQMELDRSRPTTSFVLRMRPLAVSPASPPRP